MNIKNTWSLVVAAAALFAFIYFFERDAGPQVAVRARHVLLNRLQPALVSRIEMQVGTNTVALERTNNTWRVSSPVPYPAFQPAVKNFLDGCAALAWTTKITANDLARSPRGLADYGLQPALAKFTLVQNNERLEVKIGDETPVGGERYVQVGDEIATYLVDARIAGLLPKHPAAWRDISILPRTLAFNRIEIQAGSRLMELQREETNQVWRITKPIFARADNVRVRDMIQQWREWPVTAFVSDNPAATELERLGLKAPELQLSLGHGTNNVFNLQFGATFADKPDWIFALRSSHTNVVLTPQQWVEPLRSPFSDFRERRLLTFSPEQPEFIQVESEEAFMLQRQTNGAWNVVGQTNFNVDQGLVTEMLLNLNSLEVVDFAKDNVTDWSAYGLAQPAHRYTLLAGGTNPPPAGTNTLVAQLDLGTVEGVKIFARRRDEPSAYTLLEASAERLPRTLFHLRDRRVWSFSTNEVKRITIVQEGRKHELEKNAKGVWSLAAGYQGSVNPFAVEETVYRLGEMRAIRWVARGPLVAERYGVNTESHAITLTLQRNGGQEEKLMLRLGRLTPARNAYAATILDGVPVVFEMPQALHDYIEQYLNAPRLPRLKQ